MKGEVFDVFSRKSRSVRDLLVIIVLGLLVVALSSRFDIFQGIIDWVFRHDTWQLDDVLTATLFLVIAFALYAWRRHRELLEEIRQREKAEAEASRLAPLLESSRAEISTLAKLLPICSQCMRIREDKGYWIQVDQYMELHYGTRLDGGLCPECARKKYGAG
jgi:hypothetical protein